MTWHDKHHHSNGPLFLLLSPTSSPTSYTEHDAIGCGKFLWSVWVACAGSVSSQSPMHLQLPCPHGSTKSRKGLGSVQDLFSNNKNISIFIKPVISMTPKLNIIPVIGKKINSTPTKDSTEPKSFVPANSNKGRVGAYRTLNYSSPAL